ncbi:MAG: hypothetical protein RL701_7034 [Pseudomonadota bacterium]|jgi:hypothetical protein
MNEMTLLLGLLVISYFGNALIVPGQAAAINLPSGAHFILLGFLLGPHALGVVPSDAAASFMPLAIVAISWLALVLGTNYGFAGNRRLTPRAFVLGFVVALLSASVIGGLTYLAARYLALMSVRDAQLLGLGIGLSGSETTRQSVRWALDRGVSPGPLLRLLEELAGTDEIVPLLGLAWLFALSLPAAQQATLSQGVWSLLTLGLGIVFGVLSALLVAGVSAVQEGWIVIFGAALLGTGIAFGLSLSPLTALFVMGMSLSLTSRHAPELRPFLTRTAPGVLLPALLLVGALLRVPAHAQTLFVLLAAVLARIVLRVLIGRVLARTAKAEPERRTPFGLALCCTGSANVIVSLSFALRFPGPVGDLVLSTAVATGVAGDLLGTWGLRHAFVARGPAGSPTNTGLAVNPS